MTLSKSNITLVPTLEELQAQILRDQNLLADLHENGECLDNCILCQQTENESYVWEVDEMLKAHLSVHSKRVGYPYFGYCEYCQVEWWISEKKEFSRYEH